MNGPGDRGGKCKPSEQRRQIWLMKSSEADEQARRALPTQASSMTGLGGVQAISILLQNLQMQRAMRPYREADGDSLRRGVGPGGPSADK